MTFAPTSVLVPPTTIGDMADQTKRPYWTGLGISMGAGLGVVVGLIGWGGTGIALGAAFGVCIGLIVGAVADSMRST